MRQVVLAIMLIGAAFAGGAVVNGPGLKWVRDQVLNKMGGDDGDAPVADNTTPTVDAGIPSAPVPTLTGETPSPSPAATPKSDASPAPAVSPPAVEVAQNVPKPFDPAAEMRPSAERANPSAQPPAAAPAADAPAPLTALPPLEAPIDSELQRPVGTNVAQAVQPPAPKPPEPAPPSNPPAATAANSRFADAADSGPAAAVPPKGYQKPVETDAAVAPAAAVAGDWTSLRRRMATLGITRYGFEGEPNGRVRFHCIIPLAGRRAVGQQFEAEGDDEFQAAQSALRRVALWQATENH